MRVSYKGLVLRNLDCLFRHGTAPSGDGALLDRFRSGGGESAFEALVARHGPMVLGVCRRLLDSPHDADDAFQATFLVLARKAARIRDPDRLGPWLYGVATRVATKAKTRAARHRHEPLVECCARDRPDAEWSDVMPILDAELGRLPPKHRDVLVLCLIEGVSAEEASRRLGCPVGTVKSRLARGRQSLRARLVARGIAPGVALAALSAKEALASPIRQTLIRATLAAITTSAVAPGVVALTGGVTSNMLSRSTVTATVLVGGIALAGMGAATWMRPSRAQVPGGGTPIPGQPSQDRRQAQTNNMKQVLLAFHNYASAHDRLPAAANYGADGQPKLSWRVALLPYLDQDALYREFRQDEPWDSPHNEALIARMPSVFETPAVPALPGQTRIRGFAGKGAIFEGTRGIRFPSDIPDGTSNTLLIAVAREAVPWTKPGELPFVEGQPLPVLVQGHEGYITAGELPFVEGQPLSALDDHHPNGYQIGLVDGSVRTVPLDEARLLPYLITRAGGEVIAWPQERAAVGGAAGEQTPPRPTAPVAPTIAPRGGRMGGMMIGLPGPTPSTPQALEQRLQRVEEKLDRILRKLDAAFPGGDTAK
jgi:RNA polymerase sigma factor (sigma-70 family)